jgi:RNA polymerase sigma-70 factor (ECF subfamily)
VTNPLPEPKSRPATVPGYSDAAFDAFVQSSVPGWVRLAHLYAGSREEAESIAYEVALQLHETWEDVLEHERNPALHALAVLRAVVEARFPERSGDRLVENAAFLRAMAVAQHELAVLAESIGVYSAISRLPERQFQVIVLRYVHGYPVRRAALLMGVSPQTIASLTYYARRALARDLGIGFTAPDKEEYA